MNQLSSISRKQSSYTYNRRMSFSYQSVKALINRFGFMLLIVISAVLGITLQVYLRKIDPLSAMIDSSIWVVVCYTLCSFLIFHMVSLRLTKLLLNLAKTNVQTSLKSKTWHGKLYFIGLYFLFLYGFLFCLQLWM